MNTPILARQINIADIHEHTHIINILVVDRRLLSSALIIAITIAYPNTFTIHVHTYVYLHDDFLLEICISLSVSKSVSAALSLDPKHTVKVVCVFGQTDRLAGQQQNFIKRQLKHRLTHTL